MNRLCVERMATSLRYGLLTPRLAGETSSVVARLNCSMCWWWPLTWPAARASARELLGDDEHRDEARVKAVPPMVATSLVKKLRTAVDQQHQEDQRQADRHVDAADRDVERDLVLALLRSLKRSTTIDRALKTKLQTTPKA